MIEDRRFIAQAIASNDRDETELSDFLRRAEACHLCDIFRDLRIAEEALRHAATPQMMDSVDFVCAHPMAFAAFRLAVGLAVVRVRSELITRAEGLRDDPAAPGSVPGDGK